MNKSSLQHAWFWCVAFLVGAALTCRAADHAELFGQILDRVACERDETQSYALYVPSFYRSDRKWPVIFCFDASARGRMPVERLQAAAEKYGYIVAGSLNSRNGPWEANAAAVNAMVRDVSAHFSIDAQRVYTTGVSGGARVATSVALGGIAKGVIACAAGFPVTESGVPSRVPFVFFGTTGTEDFNYGEMRRLERELEERKATHRLAVFAGGHEWASAALMTEAVEWLELQAMRKGARAKDDALIQTLFERRREALPQQPALERWRAVKSFVADFEGLAEIGGFVEEANALASSRAVKEALKAERALESRESAWVRELGETAIGGIGRKRKVADDLRQKADQPEDSLGRQAVRRAIATYASMTRETVRVAFEQEEYGKAAEFLELAALLRPKQAQTWYDLARAQAFTGDNQRAFESFRRAVAAGFGDAARAEAEPAFARLRNEEPFKRELTGLRAGELDTALQLPAMRVSAALASIELRLFYLPKAGAEPLTALSFLRVETVHPNTMGALAGVEVGMEITAIQGLRVRGLTEPELNEAMNRTVKNEVVLTVRDPRGKREKEIHIPLRKPVRL